MNMMIKNLKTWSQAKLELKVKTEVNTQNT